MTETKKNLVLRLLAASRVLEVAEGVIDATIKACAPMLGDEMTRSEMEQFRDAFKSVHRELLQEMLPVYDLFTEEELQHQVAYLEHPITQQVLKKNPAVMVEQAQRAVDFAQRRVEAIILGQVATRTGMVN